MADRIQDLGVFTAYGEAREAGYEGSKAEFELGLKKSAEYAENAQASATAAAASADDAELSAAGAAESAEDAETSASEAAQSAGEAAESATDAAESAQSVADSAAAIGENARAIGFKLYADIKTSVGMINTNGVWGAMTNNKYGHSVIPITGGSTITMVNRSGTYSYYSFFATYETPVADASPDYATGYTGRVTISTSQVRATVAAPSDAAYLYIQTLNNNTSIAPAQIIINGYDISKSAYETIQTLTPLAAQATPNVRWCMLGDSIAQGTVSDTTRAYVDTVNGWPYKVAAARNWQLANLAVGGQGFIDLADRTDAHSGGWELAAGTDFTPYNLVTVAWGLNDYKGNISAGTITDDSGNPQTIYAGIKSVIESIMTSNPACKLILITPFNSMGYSTDRLGDYSTNYAINNQREATGETLADTYNAIVACARFYGIEYIDMTYSSVINRQNIASMLPDGVHPSVAAHELLARELGAKIHFGA